MLVFDVVDGCVDRRRVEMRISRERSVIIPTGEISQEQTTKDDPDRNDQDETGADGFGTGW